MPNATQNKVEYLQEPVHGISVIVPCKDEETAVGGVVAGVDEVLRQMNLEYEIIVVDDGSTDQTQATALAAGARVLVHNINMGYGNSILDGIRIAKYPIIAMLDGDGTYPASMLPEMIEQAASHDMVIGVRAWNKTNTSLLGKIFRRWLYLLILYFSDTRAPDYNSGLRVFHKLDVLNYRPILCPTFSFTTSLTLLYLLMGRCVLFVDIDYGQRIGSSKVSYVRDAIRTLSYVFIMISLFQPYRLSLVLVLAGLMSNLLIMLVGVILPFGLPWQLGLHVSISLAVIVSAMALNVYPTAKLYLDHLERHAQA
jgi:glycosyltransferase involved in cell wall biosynthesis